MRPLQRVRIQTPKGESGELSHDQDYLFHYGIGARAGQQISLTMGVRDMPYESRGLHPVFQMNLPCFQQIGTVRFFDGAGQLPHQSPPSHAFPYRPWGTQKTCPHPAALERVPCTGAQGTLDRALILKLQTVKYYPKQRIRRRRSALLLT